MAQILLIRHGQASWGKSNYDALSDLGFEQSRALGKNLKQRGIKPDKVITGTLVRHQQTAKACLEGLGATKAFEEDARWNEFDHEELIARYKPLYSNRLLMMADLARTGQPKKAFQQMFEKALDRWVGGDHHHDYDESWPQFQQRTQHGLDALQSSSARTTLVFTSGGAISAIVASLWNMPTSEWSRLNRVVVNASITKIVVGKQGINLSTFNDHSHFEGVNSELLSYR